MPDTGWLRVRGLSKSYHEAGRERAVLHDLDLELARGEGIALVGRSGCGKSTLLNLIAGIDRPDAGTVEIAGTRISQLDERRRTLFRRRHIGFVFQFFNLIPTLTVMENLLLPLELGGQCDAAGRTRAAELLAAVGLAGREASYPDHLSGGEQQRLAIARAIVHRPALLLADEPTGNLDPETSIGIMQLLYRINKAGTTVLVATHDAHMVDRMRRRVIEMQSGRVVRDEDDGLYRQADQNTAEFGAMLRGDDGMPLQRRAQPARRRSAEELFDEAFGDDVK